MTRNRKRALVAIIAAAILYGAATYLFRSCC
ncbi:hypothetical protein FHS64_001646 [Brevundimonas terrae]|nr:hypothetical protein [Brevundimonas terrae]